MTRYEEIKKKTLSDMAHDFCEMVDDCEGCPVRGRCESGRNGFKVWLEEEVKDE